MRALLYDVFQVAGVCVFVAGTGVLAVADARMQLIPSRWLYPCAWATGASLVCAAAAGGAWLRLVAALASGAVALVVFLVLHRWSGMGMGDVRLAGLLALLLGWFGPRAALAGIVLGFLVGGLAGGVMLASGRLARGSTLPFGTCLVAGCWLVLLTLAFRAG